LYKNTNLKWAINSLTMCDEIRNNIKKKVKMLQKCENKWKCYTKSNVGKVKG